MSRNLYNPWFYYIIPIIGFYRIFVRIIGWDRLSVLPNIRPIIRFLPIIGSRIFGFYRLFKFYFFQEINTDFTDYTNIRLFTRIFGFHRLLKILFFSKNPTDFTDYTNIRFLTRIFGRIFGFYRLFKFYFFLKNQPILPIIRIFGFLPEYSVFTDY
jgi:hypothetical protein